MTDVQELKKILVSNHEVLMKKLSTTNLSGKWVAVANKKVFSGTNYSKVLSDAKDIQPEQSKILITKINSGKVSSLRF
ncbi:hypothetical protein JXM83_02610 [Candidatus Woesearchaeota archaeon]|nr:hypothetical protein [Candidatus Woesearchaeota archaeon]